MVLERLIVDSKLIFPRLKVVMWGNLCDWEKVKSYDNDDKCKDVGKHINIVYY